MLRFSIRVLLWLTVVAALSGALNHTGNFGIGFVASHTYGYEFQQRLKQTQDRELKRLYVPSQLYGDAEFAVNNFRRGEIYSGKDVLGKAH